MRKNVRSLLCLLLVLAMVLSLAACGQMQEQNQEKTDAPEEHPDTVYTYESLKLDNKILPNGITPMVYTDEGFYGQVYDEVVAPRPLMADGAVAETEETASEETAETEGETETEGDPAEESSAAPNYGVKLFFVGYDGTIRELPAYQPLPAQGEPGRGGKPLYRLVRRHRGGDEVRQPRFLGKVPQRPGILCPAPE